MGYDREHLSKLLEFIRVLYNDPSNGEFADKLREIVGSSPTLVKSDKIDKIEKYLALDYGLDTVDNPDYVFIKDAEIRGMLNADYREMLRCAYGTRGHKTDFSEYCRHAALQIELLLNYYYDKKYDGNISEILDTIQYSFSFPIERKKISSVSDIALKLKIDSLENEFNWASTEYYSFIAEARNGASHRSGEDSIETLSKKVQRLESKTSLSPEEAKQLKSANWKIGYLNRYEKWYSGTPYSQVFDSVNNLAKRVANELSY